MHAIPAEYLQSTLKGNPTCSSYSGTVLYETHRASQEEYNSIPLLLNIRKFRLLGLWVTQGTQQVVSSSSVVKTYTQLSWLIIACTQPQTMKEKLKILYIFITLVP